MKRLLAAAAVALVLLAAAVSASALVEQQGTTQMMGSFDWSVVASAVPFTSSTSQQYWVQWYFEGEHGYQYWLGSNVTNPARTPTTTTIVLRQQLADIAGCEYQPEPCDLHGDYYATIYKVEDGVYTYDPLTDSTGAPYTFEQDLDSSTP